MCVPVPVDNLMVALLAQLPVVLRPYFNERHKRPARLDELSSQQTPTFDKRNAHIRLKRVTMSTALCRTTPTTRYFLAPNACKKRMRAWMEQKKEGSKEKFCTEWKNSLDQFRKKEQFSAAVRQIF
eukprot:9513-Pelagomonas_calceolata.AAC.3